MALFDEFLLGKELSFIAQMMTQDFVDKVFHWVESDFKLGNRAHIAVSIGYIDKRPIVNFDFSEHNNGVELGDLVVAVEHDVLTSSGNNEPKEIHRISRAFILQGKLSNSEKSFKPKSAAEKKQQTLIKTWPEFRIQRPKAIKKALGSETLALGNEFSIDQGGYLLIKMQPSQIASSRWTKNNVCWVLGEPSLVDHSFEDLLKGLFSGKSGREFRTEDNWSHLIRVLLDKEKSGFFKNSDLNGGRKSNRVVSARELGITRLMHLTNSPLFQKWSDQNQRASANRISMWIRKRLMSLSGLRPLLILRIRLMHLD